MSTIRPQHRVAVPAISIERLPLFDGYPYLCTPLVPAGFNFTLLPEAWSRARLVEALSRQVDANQFKTALVLARRDAVYLSPGGQPEASELVPRCTAVLTNLLLTSEAIAPSALGDRPARLDAFSQQVNVDGVLFGDLGKGGHVATRDELVRLGPARRRAPYGLEVCPACGERRGECLDPNPEMPENWVVRVHCVCENTTCCARCLEPLRERRLNGNRFDPWDAQIWHSPGFMAGGHRCPRRV